LANPELKVTVVAPGSPPWPNGWRNTSQFVPALPKIWYAKQSKPPSRFLSSWQRASGVAKSVLTNMLDDDSIIQSGGLATSPLGPLAVADAVLAAQRAGDRLIVGASNPIRDLDLVATIRSRSLGRIFSNRGVAGIDGTIATALGIATGNITGVNRLYLGDLTFLHDAGALLAGRLENRPQLQVLIANDDGGSIFAGLEHGRWAVGDKARWQTLQRAFLTPQLADISAICAGYQVGYRSVTKVQSLRSALIHPKPGVEVIEIKVSGERLDLEQIIFNAVAAHLPGH
jgi:2-succinyl-5-enolpyruvyl-6-hydroxy-3-cyclohexene-1-carboxylate synthase